MFGRSLLIVEDHEGSRVALSAIFRRKGCEVRAVATVAEGLASLEPPPDCAVVDLMLPDGEGEDVIRAIRARGLTTLVVVCSGVGDEGRLSAVRRLGVRAVMRKPISAAEVIACFSGPPGDGREPGGRG